MIIVEYSDQPVQVFIPLPTNDVAGDFTLSARDTSGLEAEDLPIAQARVEGFLAVLSVSVAALHVGEWEYTLEYGDAASASHIARGVLVVTEDGAAVTEYNKSIEYKQYGE